MTIVARKDQFRPAKDAVVAATTGVSAAEAIALYEDSLSYWSPSEAVAAPAETAHQSYYEAA